MSNDLMARLGSKVADLLPGKENESFDEYASRVRAQPVEGLRALIAAAMLEAQKEISDERQAKKDVWIAAARRLFSPGTRQACLICGKYHYLTHAHHVAPLAEQYDRGIREPDQRHVWLCPNHHAVVHLLLDGERDRDSLSRKAADVLMDLNDAEYHKVMSLLGRNIPEAK